MTQTITWEWWGVIALYLFIAFYAFWTWWQFRDLNKEQNDVTEVVLSPRFPLVLSETSEQ